MNPRLLLSLWRERWGKAASTTFKVPYAQGKINQWTYWLPYSAVWSVTGVSAFALLSCIFLLGLMTTVSLSFNSQIVFSALFLGIAVYARRYAGTLITLVLAGMAVIASTRYLYWRINVTLVPDFSLNFIAGFCLLMAECYLALQVFMGLIQAIWPLKRAYEPLPDGQDEWPTVDIFILCYDQPYAAIKLTSMAASKLEWPKKKIKTYLIDGDHRDDLHALAILSGAHYLSHANESGSQADFINRALHTTAGTLIVLFESGHVPDKSFLQSTIGWFLQDSKLGMAQTPHYFLAPAPSRHDIKAFNEHSFAENCALLRRSVVTQVGGVDASPVTKQSHLALRLRDAGYGCAYIGFDGPEKSTSQYKTVTVEPKTHPALNVFLVEQPFLGRTILWKQRIAWLYDILQFYYTVPRLLFLIAPVLYFLGYVQVIQTSPELFAVYALPHFLHAHVARTRTQGRDRFKLVADIRETVLAWYMLLPTTLTAIRTGFSQFVGLLGADKSNQTRKAEQAKPFGRGTLVLYAFTLLLNFAGFFSGAAHLLVSSTQQQEVIILYLLWSAYNLMLLTAMFAVKEEAGQVLKHTRLRLKMPAMIKLPSGRTVSCETENFPDSTLGLSLPLSAAVAVGSAVSISIFHGHRELVFPAMVVFRQDLALGVRIVEAAQKDYQTFAVGVLSRGPEWPKWLPGRGADRPFPKGLTDAFVKVPILVLDFATNISKHLK